MNTYATTNYVLSPNDMPLIVPIPGAVALYYQAWAAMPQGFSIHFTREHLPLLQRLCEALEVLTTPSKTL